MSFETAGYDTMCGADDKISETTGLLLFTSIWVIVGAAFLFGDKKNVHTRTTYSSGPFSMYDDSRSGPGITIRF